MLVSTIRSQMDMFRTVSPPYSSTRPPFSMPSSRHRNRTMSLATTPRPKRPDQFTRTVSGTWIQISPVTATPVISMAPKPAMKQPKAPPMLEWESPPTANMPGSSRPCSASSTWPMPRMSKKRRMPKWRAKSRVSLQDGGGLRVHRRREVIRAQHDPVRIPDADAELLQPRPDAPRPAGVEQEGQVHPAGDDLAGRDAGLAGGAGEDLLGRGCGAWRRKYGRSG